MVARRKKAHIPELELCSTVEEVIKALEGDKAVREITGRSATNISNWKADGLFPSNTYVVLNNALTARGYTATPELWRMLEKP